MENKLTWEKMSYHFDNSWKEALQPFVESAEFYKTMEFLTNESKVGRKSTPGKTDIFRCFRETKINEVHTVFLGLSPYPQIGVADGILFSNSYTSEESPSLKVILNAVENDLGYVGERDRDLKRWANQGVLMLNIALTCQIGLPKSHLEVWKPFISFLYSDIFKYLKLKFVYFGADAREFQILENKELHKSLTVEHPSYSARQERPMIHKNLFTWVNEMLKSEGKSEIKWMEYKDSLPWKEEKKQEYKEFI